MVGLIVAAAFIIICGYSLFSWVMAKRAIVAYCSSLSAGTSMEVARKEAVKRGLRFYSSRQEVEREGSYVTFVTSSGVMGRYVCSVEFEGHTVMKTTLRFND